MEGGVMKLSDEYAEMEKIESQISDWLKGKFLKERLLFGEMADLMIEAIRPLSGHSKDTDHSELALLTLATRIFNNFDARFSLFDTLF